MSNLQSSGRGGAGNIRDSSMSVPLQPEDLQTPTLKTAVVTTGRGGTGNMAKNTDPVETRLRQDVEPVVRRTGSAATHIGRGGSGNVFVGADDAGNPHNEPNMAVPPAVGDGQGAAVGKVALASASVLAGEKDKKEDKDKDKEAGWAEKTKNLLAGKK